MHSGKILAQGSLDELLKKYAPGEFIEIKASKKPTSMDKIKGVKKVIWDPKHK